MNDEKLSIDGVDTMLYCDELVDTIFDHGYCMDQIFNPDETSLNYKMFPSKTTLAVKADREAPGAKKCKECVPVLTSTNTSRSFWLPSLVIGKSVKSRDLKNYDVQSSPIVYKNQMNAWMMFSFVTIGFLKNLC